MNTERRRRVYAALLLEGLCAFVPELLPAANGQNIITTVAGGGSNSTVATSAVVLGPRSVAVDGLGNVFIASPEMSEVFRLTPTGAISVVATAARFVPMGLAVDRQGNLFIADSANNRVLRVDAYFTIVAGNVAAAVTTTLPAGYSGDGGPATSADLNNPEGVAVDASGNLFIADTLNNRIRRVDAATGIITTVAGNGTAGYSGDGGPATGASLNSPQGVAVDPSANLFIADILNQRIRRVDAKTGVITTVAGYGAAGYSGDGGPGVLAALDAPGGVAVDGSGNLFVADAANERIRRVDAGTGVITTVAGDGVQGYSGDGGPATGARLNAPQAVAVDASGNVFIADGLNNRIRRVAAASGTISTVAGGGGAGDGGPATSALLINPVSVAADSSGNLFIADEADLRVRRVEASSGTITTVAGNGAYAYAGDDGPATGASLESPYGVAVDLSGDLFIADPATACIRRVDAATGVITSVACLSSSYGVATDHSGNLFIAGTASDLIWRVDAATGTITSVAGDGAQGYSGDGGPATAAELNGPYGVAVDGAGDLFIADTGNSRIRRVDASTGVITTVAGSGTCDTPNGDGGPAVSANLCFSTGVAADASGNVYIAQPPYMQIRRVDAVTGIITTVAGTGNSGFSGDGGPANSADLNYPTGVAVGPSGDLFIADMRNERIRKVVLTPGATLSSGSLGFAAQLVGSASPAQTVTLTSAGGANLNISAISTSSTDFTQTNNCPVSPATLSPGSTCTISVTFTPTTTGDLTGTITISDNASNSPQTISVSGTGLPAVSLLPVSLTFSGQNVGTSSSPQGVTLTNNTTSVLSITGITVSGDFAETNNCGSSVAAGANCAFAVTFTPTATGTRTGTLTVTDNAAGSPQSVSLSGQGTTPSPEVSLSVPGLTFASQMVSTASNAQPVTLKNTGNATLTIAGIALGGADAGDFTQTNNCGASVSAGASCTISVTFKPTAGGARTAELSITDNAPGSPQSVALSGTGEDFSVAAASGSSTSATVSAGQTATYNLSISPQGGLTGAVSFTCSGAPSEATCTVNPSSVSLNGSSAATTTVSVTTTAATMTAPRGHWGPSATGREPKGLPYLPAALVVLAALTVAAVYDRRSALRERRYSGALPQPGPQGLCAAGREPRGLPYLAAALLLVLAWVACGGGGGVTHNPGTPVGTYTLTLTATATSGSATLSHELNLTLTVN